MKTAILITLFSLAIPFVTEAKMPPGSIIRDNSMFIPARFINDFFICTSPDSARILFSRSLPLEDESGDTTSLLSRTIKLKNKLIAVGQLTDYKLFFENLSVLGYSYYFRLYYKGHLDRVTRVTDHKSDGIVMRELNLIDPAARIVEEKNFYQNGNVMTQTQFYFKDTSQAALKKWFTETLVREGKKTGYYYDGKLKFLQYYALNKLVDTSYTYNKQGEVLYKEVWNLGVLVVKIDNSKVTNTVKTNAGTKQVDPKRKAFLVGVDKYRYNIAVSDEMKLNSNVREYRDLDGCVNDIELLSKTLKDHRAFSPGNIVSLKDDEATKKGIVDALEKFLLTLNKGDNVFIHFSGSGTSVQALSQGPTVKNEFAFACRDVNMAMRTKGYDGYFRKSEMENIFTQIRKKVGRDGQIVISLDACETGEVSKEKKTQEGTPVKDLRGESSEVLFNIVTKSDAAMALFTAATGSELSFEMADDNNKTYGVYSYHLAGALEDPSVSTTRELFDNVISLMEEYQMKKDGSSVLRQHPAYSANNDFPLFDVDHDRNDPSVAVLPELKQSGNAYVLSVGVSQYAISPANPKLKFNNCVNDARSYAAFFENQFRDIEGEKKYHSFLLSDSTATYKNMMAAINEIIFNSKPDDYFIFNFSGYCRQLTDSTGKRVTYFVPYGLKNIADTNEIKTKGKGISLSQLKDLLQLIPANNQLFITEAGSTSAFQKEFIQALIESSPTIAALSNKNRIFMVPRSSGLDKFTCNKSTVEHGPLNYYVTNLNSDLNMYGVFQSGLYADAIKYSLNKTEVECDFLRTGYFDLFFEKEYIKDLQHFLPEEISQSRGLGVNRETKAALAVGNSKRYALVVGTDKYQGKPDWNDLRNPVLDAKDIAEELKTGFGYNVKLLLDAPIDSIYTHISWLSANLKKNDQLIIYIAGHGDFDSTLLDDGFIVCRDSKPINADPYRNSYIQYSKFSRMINRLPANQILMALDVCFGGTFDERVARNQGREKTTDYDNISNNQFFVEKLKKKTRLYLTSGGKDVVPDGLDKRHSPFALRLLDALHGRGGAAKMLTAKNLHQFVEKLKSGPLLGSFGDDEVGSEFILIGN